MLYVLKVSEIKCEITSNGKDERVIKYVSERVNK